MNGSLRLVAILVLAIAGSTALGGIEGSAHDFRIASRSIEDGCVACHTPQTTDATAVQAPLWNRGVTAATFAPYASVTLAPGQPQGVSKLCLSCHDGSVAADRLADMIGGPVVGGDARTHTGLRADHPVSVKWTHQNTATACSNCHAGDGVESISELPFLDGNVECSSCHDVHDRAGVPMLLRMSQRGSALCLHCHGK